MGYSAVIKKLIVFKENVVGIINVNGSAEFGKVVFENVVVEVNSGIHINPYSSSILPTFLPFKVTIFYIDIRLIYFYYGARILILFDNSFRRNIQAIYRSIWLPDFNQDFVFLGKDPRDKLTWRNGEVLPYLHVVYWDQRDICYI